MLVVSGFLSFCRNKIPTGAFAPKPHVVYSIEEFNKDMCVYNVSTGNDDYLEYIYDLQIVDSIGKFSIGDIIRLNTYKVAV
jgi:hypothetical protein